MLVQYEYAVDCVFGPANHIRVMRGEDDLLVVAEQCLGHVCGANLIQTLAGLVSHDCTGLKAQCGGNGQQMSFLGVKLAGLGLGDLCQIEMREQIADARMAFGFRHLVLFQCFGHRFGDIRGPVEAVRNLLATHFTDKVVNALQVFFHGWVQLFAAAGHRNCADIGFKRAIEQSQQCGFASSIQADHSHALFADGQHGGRKANMPIIIGMAGFFQGERQRSRARQLFGLKKESHAAHYASNASTVASTAQMPCLNTSGSGSSETAK